MLRKTLLFVILAVIGCYAQNTWTPNYYFTRIAQGTLNYADTLNNNWTLVDSVIKAKEDTINSVKADFYATHNYDGSHKDAVIFWDDLSTSAKSNMVQTSGNQSGLSGIKTWTSGGSRFNQVLGLPQAGVTTVTGDIYFDAANELLKVYKSGGYVAFPDTNKVQAMIDASDTFGSYFRDIPLVDMHFTEDTISQPLDITNTPTIAEGVFWSTADDDSIIFTFNDSYPSLDPVYGVDYIEFVIDGIGTGTLGQVKGNSNTTNRYAYTASGLTPGLHTFAAVVHLRVTNLNGQADTQEFRYKNCILQIKSNAF